MLFRSPNKMFLEIHDEVRPNFIWRAVLKRINGLVSTNRFKKDQVLRDFHLPAEKTLVWPNAVDIELFNLKISQKEARNNLYLPEKDFLACYIGRFKTMGREKGVREIIKAAGLLKGEDVKMVLVGGENKEIKDAEKLAEAIGASDECIFVSPVPWKLVPLYLKAADVLLMPFPNTRHYALAMSPRKMFEYMASRRPIIASDLPAVREVLDDDSAVFLTKPSAEGIAEAVLGLKSDTAKGQRKAERAFLKVKSLTWEARADDILSFINSSVQSRVPYETQ